MQIPGALYDCKVWGQPLACFTPFSILDVFFCQTCQISGGVLVQVITPGPFLA